MVGAASAHVCKGGAHPRRIVRKTAAGQHHAVPRFEGDETLGALGAHAAHPAVAGDQFLDGGSGVDGDAQIERRLGQAGGQRVAAGDLDAAPIEQQFLEVMRQSPGHVPEGGP